MKSGSLSHVCFRVLAQCRGSTCHPQEHARFVLHVGHTSVYLNPWLHVIQDMREELNKVHQLTMQCAEMGKLSTMQDKRWVQQCHVLQRLDHCCFPQRRLEMMEPRKPLVRDWKALWVAVKLIKKNRQAKVAGVPSAASSSGGKPKLLRN